MPSEEIDNLAKKILSRTEELTKKEDTDKYGFIDPITIIMIIAIIVNIIRVIQECKKKETTRLSGSERATMLSSEIKLRSLSHSWLTRMRIRGIIKKHLNKEQNAVYAGPLMKALFESGADVTDEQVSALLTYKN